MDRWHRNEIPLHSSTTGIDPSSIDYSPHYGGARPGRAAPLLPLRGDHHQRLVSLMGRKPEKRYKLIQENAEFVRDPEV